MENFYVLLYVMNNFLIKYFEIVGFVLWWITWLSINRISNIIDWNIRISVVILIVCWGLFVYWFITKNKLLSFKYNVEKGAWKKEIIYDKEVWICENNPMFQIKKGNDCFDFTEMRTQAYPDAYWSYKYTVELITNGIIIKTLTWVSCDWWRVHVPIPKQEVIQKSDSIDDIEVKYYWDKDSIEFKIGKIIGDFYAYNDMEGIARVSEIEIR